MFFHKRTGLLMLLISIVVLSRLILANFIDNYSNSQYYCGKININFNNNQEFVKFLI